MLKIAGAPLFAEFVTHHCTPACSTSCGLTIVLALTSRCGHSIHILGMTVDIQPSLTAFPLPICRSLQPALQPASLQHVDKLCGCLANMHSAVKSDSALPLCLQVPSTPPCQRPACSAW